MVTVVFEPAFQLTLSLVAPVRVQERFNGTSWKSAEHVGYYLNGGLHVADTLRLAGISSLGSQYRTFVESLEVRLPRRPGAVCVCACVCT